MVAFVMKNCCESLCQSSPKIKKKNHFVNLLGQISAPQDEVTVEMKRNEDRHAE